jgi:hypothetical protein
VKVPRREPPFLLLFLLGLGGRALPDEGTIEQPTDPKNLDRSPGTFSDAEGFAPVDRSQFGPNRQASR